ncbi:hypothetical protein KQI41_03345 [Tissierella pigra]|uniref:hypothetical protein n=1 Tax=Tissierella pigra TaxID=2607614 RepID=UPI001C116C89|nr:hypothetical protein [Tissierella pigra]MBU5425439.1 hypothetical protein [Tissierella pigra]
MKTRITSNVLEDISKRLLNGDNKWNQGNKESIIVAFNGSNNNLDKKIEEIKCLKNKGIKISLAFSFMAEQILDIGKITNILSPRNIYGESDIVRLKEISRNYSGIICPNITVNTISKISLGMIDSFVPNLIWTFMYQSKNVYMDFEGVKNYLGEETNNKEILSILEGHMDRAKKMGAIEIEHNKYTENIVIGVEDENIKSNSKSEENPDKKVITEKDILNLSSNSKLILPKGAIVTHLARDKASAKNIKIEIR